MRYIRVRIHDDQDPQYRAYIANIMASKTNHKAMRPPSNRSIFGGEAEQLLRTWLSQWYTLSNRRFVEYDERLGTQVIRKYRELDAVIEVTSQHIHVCEIKASSHVRSISRGLKQLRETRAILQGIYPTITSNLLLVDTGIITTDEVAVLMADPDAPLTPPQTLADFARNNPKIPLTTHAEFDPTDLKDIAVVHFGLDDICQLAGDTIDRLHLDWSDELEEDEDSEPPAPTIIASHDSADVDAESPLAAALKRALDARNTN